MVPSFFASVSRFWNVQTVELGKKFRQMLGSSDNHWFRRDCDSEELRLRTSNATTGSAKTKTKPAVKFAVRRLGVLNSRHGNNHCATWLQTDSSVGMWQRGIEIDGIP